MPASYDLQSLEGLLYRLITAPSGVAEGLAIEKVLDRDGLSKIIAADERLSSVERVDIYANMYFYRLLEVLQEDFPATLAMLGADRFHNLVTGYLIEYPPEHFSIMYAGRHLADFLRHHPLREEFPFIADLARIERSLIEVFHGADAPALDAEQMRAIAPANWASMKLGLHPAIEILQLEWKVPEVLRAVERGEEPPPPAHDGVEVLVWRNLNVAHYREIDAAERDLLAAIAKGISFAEICEAIASGVDAEDPAAVVNRRLEVWLREGILIRV